MYILRISSILNLFLESTTKIFAIKFLSSLEYIYGIWRYTPLHILIPNDTIDSPSNGYFNAHNSYNNIPNDHISDLWLYG